MAGSAAAAPPAKRVINDPFEPSKAYDIIRVVLKAQPAGGDWAVVRVLHSREVQVGDSIDFWFNLDADKEPDIHVVGDAFSEYNVYKTDNFLEDGKNINKRDCFRLRMADQRLDGQVRPRLHRGVRPSTACPSSRRARTPTTGNDYVRAPGKFTKKVLSHA